MSEKKGKLFVVTGPSGVGKGTILTKFFENKSKDEVCYSVSMTTRSPRPVEVDGVNYFFVDKDTFKNAINNNEFLEWTEYSGNLYGTNRKFVENKISEGINVVLEIETDGASKVMEKFPECISVFFTPPSLSELEYRLRGRKTEDEESVKKRLKVAQSELSQIDKYLYNIVNDEVESALNKFIAVYEFETATKTEVEQ